MPERLILFIDNQNMYKGARNTFFERSADFTEGQFDPVSMGELICSRPPKGFTRELVQTRVYTGQPDGSKDPVGYGASRKQYAYWERRGATVIRRPLRYPRDFPMEKPQEKGIDVRLAIDFVAFAIDGSYDVGVIASTDTDLIPAIDFVTQRYSGTRRVEVTAWNGPLRNPRLSSKLARIWCHWLGRDDYQQIKDPTNYAI